MFLENIFLKIIKSPHSTYAHKKMALKVIHKLCSDSHTIVEVFLNYDCDMDSSGIFQLIVERLEKTAQGTYNLNWMSDEQQSSLRYAALLSQSLNQNNNHDINNTTTSTTPQHQQQHHLFVLREITFS